MKNILIVFITLLSIQVSAQFNTDNLQLMEEEELDERYQFNRLKIYPIRANSDFRRAFESLEKFNNLEKAIEQKKIKITEVSDSGTVNTLVAENTSNESIYIMAGEVVKGGKQDRIIGQDIVLAPGEKKNLDAFCVEQGRWEAQDSGKNFNGYMNVSSKGIRKAAVISKDQSRVWDNVAEVTSANKAESQTGTYAALEKAPEYKKELEAYLKAFDSSWDHDSEVIGVVAVTGDQIIGCDLFASHELFVNAYNNLMHSYITEAITNGKEITITRQRVQAYLNEFLADESKQKENLDGKGALFEHKGKKIHITKF